MEIVHHGIGTEYGQMPPPQIIRPSSNIHKDTGNTGGIVGNNKEGKRKRRRNRNNQVLTENKAKNTGSDSESENDNNNTSPYQNINGVKHTDKDSKERISKSGNIDQSDDSDSDSSNDNDDDDNNGGGGSDAGDESKSSDSESDNELHILGEMKSSSADKVKEERKKRRLEKKKSEKTQAEIKQEQINLVRKKSNVHVYGTDIPEPLESFEVLQSKYNLHKYIVRNIETVGYKTPTPIQLQAIPVMLNPLDSFEVLQSKYNLHKYIVRNIETVGYKTPTPIQLQAIPVMLNNRDILACAPTGSGKTAAFIIPILHHLKEPRNVGVRALALAPTRELAQQTYREFQRLSEGMGFRIGYVDKVGSDFDKVKKIFRKSDIMVATPNRLVYLLEQTPPLVTLTSVKWLVVDESDKLFEDGKSGFREQLATIYKSCDGSVRRAMFSATFTHDVEQWCKLNLDNVVQVYIGEKNRATVTVEQSLLFCGSEHGKLLAIREIIRKGIDPPVLVFVQSKDRAKELFHELIYDGMNVDVIHAERTQTQRDNVVKCFRSGKIWILICTELMGRGIDFKGVNLVINYDFPNSSISYIHRIGRTGRAGRPGKAITFFTEDDGVFLRSIAGVMKSAGCPVPDYMINMKKPNKQFRKRMSKTSLKRASISTAPGHQRKMSGGFTVKKNKSNKGKPNKGNQSNKNKRKRTDDGETNNVKKQKTGDSTSAKFKSQQKSKKHKQFNRNNKNKSFKNKGDKKSGKRPQQKT